MDERLIAAARAAAENAHAPYSGFKVGAALVSDDGALTVGCNLECSSFGATICAERAALAAAIAQGKRSFSAIAVWTDTDEPTPPCGICRQMLADFSPTMKVICACRRDAPLITTIAELLPHTFGPANLGRP
ncbi:MAG: cytidine deaminase [Myxococcales bacterium]|nr:MAG: cytidine deaminase [Myxococcales bacterium]